MNNLKSGAEIRQSFIEYFLSKGHTLVPSASLVPGSDHTLLFTNAGMVQFKNIFLGKEKQSFRRAVNSQKCMRVAGKHNDLDDVGQDDTHHTFFEMLGNWSFGDYYKKEAISWAWELLTENWGLDKSRLWVTCFKDEKGEIPTDDEAISIWHQQPGIVPSQILQFGRKDNFWEMADTGPCGPCSEISYDLGNESCNLQHIKGHNCEVNGTCRRFVELWNLVFIQYNRLNANELISLPEKHVDTGMGLDRIVSILEGVDSNYRTDLFTPLIESVRLLTGHTISERDLNFTPYRVIVDHVRAASFLIADGVIPGNIGRNYVCRMIIRRAALFGSKIGLTRPFLGHVASEVIKTYGDAYPELIKNQLFIYDQLKYEEKRFKRTVEAGLKHLNESLEELTSEGEKVLKGSKAFDLYATHGLPLEITRDIAREKGMDVDEQGFKRAMEEHRFISSGSQDVNSIEKVQSNLYSDIFDRLLTEGKVSPTGIEYDPYSYTSIGAEILAIIQDMEEITSARQGDEIDIVIDPSPFYIESGGQVSDTGKISARDSSWEIEVSDTYRPSAGIIILRGVVQFGNPQTGDATVAQVDHQRRNAIMRNHTATHLLHAALRNILGEHVRQSGSLVAPDHMRFDFSHPEGLSAKQLEAVELQVNHAIFQDYSLRINTKPIGEALSGGAIALFGEKYSNQVRTVSIGPDERISYELCGGTHVERTSDIGIFLIQSEGSIASGMRRIEAITGEYAYYQVHLQSKILSNVTRMLNTPTDGVAERIELLVKDLDEANKLITKLQRANASSEFNSLSQHVPLIQGVPVLSARLDNVDAETLRILADRFRQKYLSGVVVLGSISNARPIIIAAITEDLTSRGLDAVELVRTISKTIGGGGGGKATFAQSGGKDVTKLSEALNQALTYVQKKLINN